MLKLKLKSSKLMTSIQNSNCIYRVINLNITSLTYNFDKLCFIIINYVRLLPLIFTNVLN